MAFGFSASDFVPSDLGVTVPAPSAPTLMPAPAAPQPQQGQGQPYKPSFWDILQGVVFDSQSPANAAMAARSRDYQSKVMGLMGDALRTASPDQRAAMLLNPAEAGKALADRLATHALKGGETGVHMGPGGSDIVAQLLGFDDKSGRGYSVGAGGATSTGGAPLPGDYDAKDGIISSKRTGDVANTYSLPQIVAPGSTGTSFTPAVSGPGPHPSASPTAAPGSAAASAGSSAPRGIRNNNFGNLRALPSGHAWAGQTGVDAEGYAVFGNPADGLKAAAQNLNSYAAQGINTLSSLAKRWAPASDHNDPTAYAHYLAGKLGVGPTDKIDLTDPATQKTVLHGIADFENGPAAMSAWKGKLPTSSGAGPKAAPGGGFGQPFAQGKEPHILSPAETVGAGYAPGTVVERAPDGTTKVTQATQYGSEWARGQRDSFTGWGPVKQYQETEKPTYDALVHNIGQMTGPAAYAILDTAIRTDNPGMGTRQQQLEAFEHKFGPIAGVMGQLLNFQGKGSIPPDVQQKILNAAIPFAQAHYDAANNLYGAQANLAKAHGVDPTEVTTPIGDRPMPAIVLQRGANGKVVAPPAAQRKANTIYIGPNGPGIWTGSAWQPLS